MSIATKDGIIFDNKNDANVPIVQMFNSMIQAAAKGVDEGVTPGEMMAASLNLFAWAFVRSIQFSEGTFDKAGAIKLCEKLLPSILEAQAKALHADSVEEIVAPTH